MSKNFRQPVNCVNMISLTDENIHKCLFLNKKNPVDKLLGSFS